MNVEKDIVPLLPKLKKHALKLAQGNQTEAEDCLQDTLVTFLEVQDKANPQHVISYAHQSLKNHWITRKRNAARKTDSVELQDTIPSHDNAESRVEVSSIYNAISKLSEQRQDIVMRFAIEGYTAKELAQDYNITPTTVNVMLHQSRKKLREYLD